MKANSPVPMRQPGIDKTGPVPVQAAAESIPVEQLVQRAEAGTGGSDADIQDAVPHAARREPGPGASARRRVRRTPTGGWDRRRPVK